MSDTNHTRIINETADQTMGSSSYDINAVVLEVHYEQGWSLCSLRGDGFAVGSSGSIKIYKRLKSCSSPVQTMYTCDVVLEGHILNIASLVQLQDGRLLSGSYDGMIKVWNIESTMKTDKHCLRTITLHSNSSVRCLAIHTSGVVGDDCVVSGGLSGHINVTSLNDHYKLDADDQIQNDQ